MLRQFGPSTWAAIVLGSVLAILCFLPVVAARYRAAGRLRAIDLVTLLAVAVYAVALWTYTLVPLPQTDTFRCAAANLQPFAFADAIRADGRSLIRNRAFLQAALNVLLFLPLGWFLRILAGRGVVVATAAGFVISSAIEATQYTGIWGLYHCAYRVFDVDDVILNTFGALLGSLVAVPVATLLSTNRPAPPVTQVTLGRRLVGMLADVMVVAAINFVAVVAWRAAAHDVLELGISGLPAEADQFVGFAAALAVEAWWVLVTGRTVGEAIVQLQPVDRRLHPALGRPLKLLFGVGGYLILTTWLSGSLAALAFPVATVAFAALTPGRRGLSHLVAGMDLELEPQRVEQAAPN